MWPSPASPSRMGMKSRGPASRWTWWVSESQYNIYRFACYGLCLLGKIMHLNRVSMLSISVFRPLLKNQIYCRPDGPRSQRMRAKRLGCMKPPWRNILNYVLHFEWYVIIVMFWPPKWPRLHSTPHASISLKKLFSHRVCVSRYLGSTV